MTKTSKTVVFFGNERLATGVATTASTLQRLIADGYNVAAVVSHNEATQSRKQRPLEIAALAEAHGIPVLLPHKPSEIQAQLAAYNADIGVLAAYGKIVPQSIIDLFPHGIINIHPSLLPKHRGPVPLEAVILQGEQETGVSIMQLVKAMDAGPIFAQARLPLSGTETKQALADELLRLGADMVSQLLPLILADNANPTPQDDAQATYDELIDKHDGQLDFGKPALQLEREIRAYLGWPNSRTTIGAKEVVITSAHVIDEHGDVGKVWKGDKSFGFYTSDGVLVVDSLKPAGKNEMTAEAFLAGHRL